MSSSGSPGPARVYFDLRNVQLTPALLDTVLTYPSDVVNKIRTGRHPDHVVRVVLDLEDVAKYSVFTLYNPFRLVIDAERTAERAATIVVPPLPSSRLAAVTALLDSPKLPMVAPMVPMIIAEPAPTTASGAGAGTGRRRLGRRLVHRRLAEGGSPGEGDSPASATAGDGDAGDAVGEYRGRLLDREAARAQRVAHRDRSRAWRSRPRRARQGPQ